MDMKKRASFAKKCGKKRQKFSKGGMIKKIGNRKYFDDGGTVLGGPTAQASNYNPATSGIAGANAALNNKNNLLNNNFLNPGNMLGGWAGPATGILNGITNMLTDNFQATGAPIQQGTNAAQLNQAYTGAQGALDNQGNLVEELKPQIPTAVQNQNAVAQSELNMLNGTGPNPALNQLNQTTGQNIAATTAEMAGQRGASVNPGLIAREAAQQGATTQQNSVGQAATLKAQQQVQAQNDLANLSNNQISQTGQAITNQNNANQGEQAILQNANTSGNNAAVGMQSNINNVNSQTAAVNQNMAGKVLGGIGGALSSILNKGGEVGVDGKDHHILLAEMNAHSLGHAKKLADGGEIDGPDLGKFVPSSDAASSPSIPSTSTLPADSSSSGGGSSGGGAAGLMSLAALFKDGGEVEKSSMQNHCAGPHDSHVANFLSKGGPVEAMVSPGEVYLDPEKVRQVIQDGANPLKIGMTIPGKAAKKGDSLKNDTVPMNLEEGGIVIPRHVTNKMSPEKAELFVHRAMARKKARA